MPKYLMQVAYNTEGIRTLLREGGSKRKAIVEELVQGLGGKVEVLYYTFGDTDVVALVDAPDHATAAAISLFGNSTGVLSLKTTVLLTADEVDRGVQKAARQRPPPS